MNDERNKLNNPYFIKNFEFKDNRGILIKNFFESDLKDFNVKESTITFSKKNSVRGLHFQIENEQAKIVSLIKGEIIDFCLDIRKNSSNYGKIFIYKIYKKNQSLLVPKGFAHGYYSAKKSIVNMFYDELTNQSQNGFSIIPYLKKEKIFNEKIIFSLNDKNLKIFKG